MRIPLAPHTLTVGEAFILQNNNEKSLYKVTHTEGDTITAERKHTTDSATAPQTINATLHPNTQNHRPHHHQNQHHKNHHQQTRIYHHH